ncbi:MAG: hypothetical protein SOR72_07550 [Hornefia sp.]|nr:hypothetical protein [Hornefia sp.]
MNRDLKTIGKRILILMLILSLTCAFTLPSAFAKSEASDMRKGTNSEKRESSKDEHKETVYIMQNHEGSEYKRIVSHDNKLYYKGFEEARLPVTMKVSYKLDGEPVQAEKLAGSSGKVNIRIQYENHIKDGNVYVPFMVITGMILDGDKFSDVKIDSGKVIDDGDKKMAAGFAFPGMNESIGLKSKGLDFPEEVNIQAHVKNFKLNEVYSVISTDVFKNIDMSKVKDMEGLQSKISQLKKGANQLLQGASQLEKGNAQMANGALRLTEAGRKISKAAKQVAEGNGALNEKAPALSSGIGKLQQGSQKVYEGNSQLLAGLKQLQGTEPSAENKTGSGLKALEFGAGQAEAGSERLFQGVKSLDGGLAKLTQNNDGLKSGLTQIIGNVETSYAKQKNSAAAAESGIAAADKEVKDLEAAGKTGTESYIAAVNKRARLMAQKEVLTQAAVESENLIKGLKAYQKNASGYIDGVAAVKDGIDKNELVKGAGTLAAGSKALAAGTKAANSAVESQLIQGAGSLVKGSGELNAGITSLQGGSSTLVKGISKLSQGSMKLYNGTVIFSNKEEELAKGASKLARGSKALNLGMSKMVSTLKSEIAKLDAWGIARAVNNAKALQKAAEQYNSFEESGNYDKLTFIYKMDEIKK